MRMLKYILAFSIFFITSSFACSPPRTITTGDLSLIGKIQYKQTLPLNDKEVVLTFDDGSNPKYTNQILEILRKECIYGVFFMVGEMVKQYPSTVQKVILEGHAVGNHSLKHPLWFERLPMTRFIEEFETTHVLLKQLGVTSQHFRFPGLGRKAEFEKYLVDTGYVIWSVDASTDDWRGGNVSTNINNVMRSLNVTRKGIILMHDRNAVATLPVLINKLRSEGYSFVRVR